MKYMIGYASMCSLMGTLKIGQSRRPSRKRGPQLQFQVKPWELQISAQIEESCNKLFLVFILPTFHLAKQNHKFFLSF